MALPLHCVSLTERQPKRQPAPPSERIVSQIFVRRERGITQLGSMTKQWLKVNCTRKRIHWSEPCRVSGSPSDDCSADQVSVVFEIKATRAGDEYQKMCLTQEEVNTLLPSIAEAAEERVCLKVALAKLVSLGDAELLDFLKSLLSRRTTASTRPSNRV